LEATAVAELTFRLRIDFQKRDRLRFLSHLEVVRALERVIRRAGLPYAVTKGFNAHMRHAPGPALPVGTTGLNEHFDLWLTEYLDPATTCRRLRDASVEGLAIVAASYVNPRAKGLQATHIHERYEIVLATTSLTPAEVQARLVRTIKEGSLTVTRKSKNKNKSKVYDLTQLVEQMPTVWAGDGYGAKHDEGAENDSDNIFIVLELKAGEQGSLRPEALIQTALGEDQPWSLKSVTRTHLYEA
jgi:radical SAM-linked protein